jgi:type VI secretion system protein ImpF
MARIRATERLRAPLMYAFRAAAKAKDAKKTLDIRENGERVIASRRNTGERRRSLSDGKLKELLAKDVTALLNTVNLESAAPELVEGLPRVRDSILNYGLRDLSDKTIDQKQRVSDIRHDLEAALKRFEPRLLPRTMRIEKVEKETGELEQRFVVQADMRADPVPTSIEFVTALELDSGEIKVNEA